MTITAAQLSQTAKALSAIDWSQIAYFNFGNIGDDAVLAEDALSVVAVFWPPAALLAEALAIAVVLEPLIATSGIHVSPDQWPERDAQLSHGGGDLQ